MSAPDSLPMRKPAGLLAEGAPWSLDVFAPVLALTVLREVDGHSEILVGVRTPEANAYHKDVVSMPTRRLKDFERVRSWLAPDGPCVDLAAAERSGSVLDEVHHLLALKLGVAGPLDRHEVAVHVLGLGAWQGISLINVVGGEEQTEDLTMLNAVVRVHEGAGLFPDETVSYRPLVWVPLASFRQAAVTHAVENLGLGDDRAIIEWCIRGLCIETAVAMLDRLDIS